MFYTESDLEDTETMISDFVENNLGASPRIMMWEEESVIYLGTVKVVEGIAELHYISIQVGKKSKTLETTTNKDGITTQPTLFTPWLH